MNYNAVHADAFEWAGSYTGALFHAILCDPPYGLSFMGKHWDHGVPDAEFWTQMAKVLHPGAFILAFCGSRGWHRQAVAMEDAGLVMHPSCFFFGYAFGTGFPKATRIDKFCDKADGRQGATTPMTGKYKGGRSFGAGKSMWLKDGEEQEKDAYVPSSNLAKAWAGHRYGLQAMKPAIEPILLFQKPYEGKPVACITKTGAGALNVDGCRIGDETARWPSNLILDDSEDVSRAFRHGSVTGARSEESSDAVVNGTAWLPDNHKSVEYTDSGSTSRFFFRVSEQLEAADPLFYTAKPGRKERDAGLDHMPLKDCGMMEDDNYPIKTGSGNLRETKRRNNHPTVKALALTKYLATLLLPPKKYAPRRICVPFLGSGSEAIGAMQAGWDEVVGIEKEAEYIPLAEARLKYWHEKQFKIETIEDDF